MAQTLVQEWLEWLGVVDDSQLDVKLEDSTTAQQWINKGFGPIERRAWAEVGEYCPVACEELCNASLTPECLKEFHQANKPEQWESYPPSYSNGDLDISDIKALLFA